MQTSLNLINATLHNLKVSNFRGVFTSVSVKNVLKTMWAQDGWLHPELSDRLYESRQLNRKGTCKSIHTDRYKIIYTYVIFIPKISLKQEWVKIQLCDCYWKKPEFSGGRKIYSQNLVNDLLVLFKLLVSKLFTVFMLSIHSIRARVLQGYRFSNSNLNKTKLTLW